MFAINLNCLKVKTEELQLVDPNAIGASRNAGLINVAVFWEDSTVKPSGAESPRGECVEIARALRLIL